MNKHWRGGYFTRTGNGTAASDGDWNEDDSGGGADSNWVDDNGVGVAKPTSIDVVYFSEMADRVPAGYSNSAYPHVVGKHWSCCANLDQSALDVQGFYVTPNFTGNIFQLKTDTMNAEAADDEGSSLLPGMVSFPMDGHPFALGDYITPSGTDYYDNEYRVEVVEVNSVAVKAEYIPETFSTSDTVTGRTPLRISIDDGGEMIIEGSGMYYIEVGDTSPDIPNLVYNGQTTTRLHLSCEDKTADWTDILIIGAGTMDVARDSSVGTVTITGDSTVTVTGGKDIEADSGGSPTVFNMYAGTVTWDSPIGASIIAGGTFNHCPNVDISDDMDIEGITGYGGVFNWYGKSWLKNYVNYGCAITALGDGLKVFGSDEVTYHNYGGTLDLSQPTGFVSLYDESVGTAKIKNHGGTFLPPKLQEISW